MDQNVSFETGNAKKLCPSSASEQVAGDDEVFTVAHVKMLSVPFISLNLNLTEIWN